ncbi:MAG: hypothetical protein H0T53_08880 [Herpetosiphonaceae bacterium]|nr:hypothetical protein [Herpetosiphonaceae bacterium]
MNTIRSGLHKTRYANGPHMVILVDDIPLDEFLAARFGDQHQLLLGLIPTLLDSLEDPGERNLTWQRIDPPVSGTTVAPVLMCADDQDFWCVIIVVEVEATEDAIIWHRFGYATGAADLARMPEAVFDTVRWFEPQERLTFTVADYQACLAQFRKLLSEEAPQDTDS